MRWLVVFVAACSFSTRIDKVPIDGAEDGTDATPDGSAPAGCRAVEIEAMAAQTCVLRNDGEVWCWGRNEDGAIGVPSQTTCMAGDACVRVPTKVTLPESIVQLGLGDHHSCAMSATKMYCWGLNSNGQFGDTTTTSAAAPREITLRAGAVAARGGDLHTCSLGATGMLCSGRNEFGEIGDMSTTQRETTTAPLDLVGVPSAIGAGFHHSCAIIGGAVSCWGRNQSGQIDTSGNNPITTPRASGVTNATAVAGGVAHTCARLATGALQCWGANAAGQLGVGNTMAQTGPQTLGLTGVSQIAAGVDHTCALAGPGVWCWGEGYTDAPTQKSLGASAIAVAAGSYHDCAILTDGTVRCWGLNNYGQLGNDSMQSSTTPVQPDVCP